MHLEKHTLLCVDDEIDNLDALERLFRKDYEVLKATSGKEALAILKQKSSRVHIIISDQRMPQMTGVEFLKKAKELEPDSIRILLTGYTDIQSVIEAINQGEVYRYVTKPWDPGDLKTTLQQALERFQLRAELQKKNEELSLAFEQLKTLDQTKSHFMILINHELKTPLTSILSFLELLEETELNEEQKKFLNRIHKSADRLREIILDVLELMSAETGTLNMSAHKVDVVAVINSLIEKSQAHVNKKHLKLDVPRKHVNVMADENILRNVLWRILKNALKFSDEDSTVTIQTKVTDGMVHIAIVNQGEPLSEENIARLLQPFAINQNIMNHSKGLGLGLSLCQALLKTMGSKLEISTKGRTISVGFALPSK